MSNNKKKSNNNTRSEKKGMRLRRRVKAQIIRRYVKDQLRLVPHHEAGHTVIAGARHAV